jgi:hypothetical protein
MSVSAGIDMARERLRERSVRVALGLGLSFELGVAVLERAAGRVGAADRALVGGAFGVAVPLVAYFLVTRACAGGHLRDALRPLARHGLDRRSLTLGLAVPPALLTAAFAVLGSALVIPIARGFGDPLWLSDVATSAWIGVVAAIAYVAAFTGVSALGRGGRGRAWLLALDFVLGSGQSFLAVPWPKGHVRNLLGGASVLQLSQLAALFVLFGTSFAFLSLGVLRNQR